MSPDTFYSLAFSEWFDALRGLGDSLGLGSKSAPPPATSSDFEGWEELEKPSPSIRLVS